MNAIASKGYAHGVEQKECVVKRGSWIQVMGVMELLVGVHDMNVSKSHPVSAQFSTKIGDQYKLTINIIIIIINIIIPIYV